MKVLSLVTNRYASFYRKQEEVMKERGIELTHIFPKRQSPDPAEQQKINRNWKDYLQIYPEVLAESRDDYDIVHSNYGLMAPFSLAQLNRPIILSLWGSDLTGKVGKLSKFCAKYHDEVIVMSEEMGGKLSCDAHVIPHGIDTDQFKPIPQLKAQEAVGWDSETAHVLFPYEPTRDVKNYPLANRIVEAVKNSLSKPVKLQVVYEVDHDDVPLYMNAADALLLTSRREGSPNSIKEAMACNLPVISTDVGGVRKWIEPVRNSYVATSDSELAKALTTVLQSDQRSDGRTHIADLSLETMATEIIKVYKKALDH